jgi:hypothetical protein
MSTFLASLLGAMGGGVGAIAGQRESQKPYKPPHSYDVAAWRDPRWRTALKNHLGKQAPNDSQLVSPEILALMRSSIDNLPESERSGAFGQMERDKIQAEIDDGRWAQWYDHFHQIVISDRHNRDFQWHVQQGLVFNLQTTAVYILISALFVPSVRHWWCILPACMWTLLLFAREYSGVTNYLNVWSTLSEQTRYLMAQEPLKESSIGK